MASIAYITDPNMLELHRLNNHHTMNFWRLSNKINFKNFTSGDFVFFLSKDKSHQRNKEKGIVGYGKLDDIHLKSFNSMWRCFGVENGYKTKEEFKEAITKVSRDGTVPSPISSLYLKEVSFFQNPVYLSDCGMDISNNVESFVYLEDESVTYRILECAREMPDMWFSLENAESYIGKHLVELSLNVAQDRLKDIKLSDSKTKKGFKDLKDFKLINPEYSFVKDSKLALYKCADGGLTILLYDDKDIDDRMIIGQAMLYNKYIKDMYKGDITVTFRIFGRRKDLEEIINQE